MMGEVEASVRKVTRSSRTPAFSEGTRISVLVDPVNPKRAIPLALYADPGAVQSGERPISAEPQSRLQKLKAQGLKHR